MTVTALAINASSGSPAYTSQQFRQALSALLCNDSTRPVGARSGYGPGHQPTTLTVTSTTWTIGAFSCVVDPAFTSTQGPYLVSNDSTTSSSVTAAAGSDRIDILYTQVNDTDIDSSGSRSATIGYLAGTAGSGVPPTTPARSFVLATISMPHSGGGSPTIAVNNTFAAAAGGLIGVPTAAGLLAGTAIATPSEPMIAYAVDTNAIYTYNGSAWVVVFEDTGWTVPSLGASWAANTGGGRRAPQYRRRSGVTQLAGNMASGTTSSTIFTLPAGYRPGATCDFTVGSGNGNATITITSAGVLQVAVYNAGSNVSVSLDNIQFIAEN